MTRKTRSETSRRVLMGIIVLAVFVSTLALINAPASAAPRATGYTIDWYTIDGGGVMDAVGGGGYALSGTIGQADAETLSGGNCDNSR